MLKVFTWLANIMVYQWLGLDPASKLGDSLHFFVEDVSKIFVLIVVMIYVVAWIRAALDMEVVRDYLVGKHRFFGYVAGASFGVVTPFCSCSSIPLFLGFTQARIPLGITMSFLITSPIINEVAVVLLGSLLGVKFMVVYVAVGVLAGIIGGFFIDLIKAERHLTPLVENIIGQKTNAAAQRARTKSKLTFQQRHEFAKSELKMIFGRVWKWVLLGVGLGAALHGFVPQSFVAENLGSGQWWSVPAAVLLGIPLYSNASGIIPVAESLLGKGLPVGTTLAFMMSTVAASFPEFMILKQVMKPKLLVIFFCLLLVMFTLVGWIFNMVQPIVAL
jgi:uncharacterized membrane protein YraQ (UPF0718 family)